MVVLTKEDIIEEVNQGRISVSHDRPIGNLGIDVSVGKLFYQPGHDQGVIDLSVFNEPHGGEVPLIDDEYWIMRPDDFYLLELLEDFHLGAGISCMVKSRSSFARFGVCVSDVDHEITRDSYRNYDGKIMCTLRTLGTTVKLRPGDLAGSAMFAEGAFNWVGDYEISDLLDKGELKIWRNGAEIKRLEEVLVEGRYPNIGIR